MTGPAGSGKSLVAAALAARLRSHFVDGDDLHTRAQVGKLSAGTPLDDADRHQWLEAVSIVLVRQAPVVIAAPPLRREYRDRLRASAADLWFAELVVAAAPPRRKRVSRRDRVMPVDLVDPHASDPAIASSVALAIDEAGARFAHDGDLGSVVDRIASVRESQSLR